MGTEGGEIMLLWKIWKALERIEGKIDRLGTPPKETRGSDEWIQKGLDSIMSFQAGKKGEGDQGDWE